MEDIRRNIIERDLIQKVILNKEIIWFKTFKGRLKTEKV